MDCRAEERNFLPIPIRDFHFLKNHEESSLSLYYNSNKLGLGTGISVKRVAQGIPKTNLNLKYSKNGFREDETGSGSGQIQDPRRILQS